MSPILTVQQRYRELGRIRMGEKGTRGAPRALGTWRLTTSNHQLLTAAAALWGGEVTAWAGAPNEGTWQLTTGTDTLPIMVPPFRDPVSQWMEQWTAGGCTHRCDTNVNVVTDEPCSCDQDNPVCKPTTRLNVMLPDLPDVGVWRLETHGWNAATELPGTIQLIQAAAQGGAYLSGALRIEARSAKRDGKTSRFVVPVIDLDVSVRELASGASQAGELVAPRPALPAPAPPELPGDPRFTGVDQVDVDAAWAGLVRRAGDERALAAALRAAGVGGRGELADRRVLADAGVIADRVRAESPTGEAVEGVVMDGHAPTSDGQGHLDV